MLSSSQRAMRTNRLVGGAQTTPSGKPACRALHEHVSVCIALCCGSIYACARVCVCVVARILCKGVRAREAVMMVPFPIACVHAGPCMPQKCVLVLVSRRDL